MLRDVGADELLGRMPIAPDMELLARNTTGKSILITGAGGSIGSELARQIVRLGPRRLVLVDIAETALYELESELHDACLDLEVPSVPEIVTVLGSILDEALMVRTMTTHEIKTIYHAAAYKHVPLVEANGIVGLRNNVFGTIVLAEAAALCDVERFVLISTDKAVHPASLMGASKRLAELVMQARAAEGSDATVFTVVRFGNVLDSSGSVVRRFRRQIETGGPVTVTHPDMVRYFMSIPEAASLVIQAGAMAMGGEVFILDMGEPVRIDELARAMITIMGLQVRDAQAPDGDIAIEYVGLRPGEKLTEELLLGKDVTGTEHPRILNCAEPHVPPARLRREIAVLDAAIRDGNMAVVTDVLSRVVEGYRPGATVARGDLDDDDGPRTAIVH
jgi:FlaA1/EpsC-like NDP-sugar epimerase